MHELNTSFVWKMDLKMLMVGIESYEDIFLYFYEFGNMKRIFEFWFLWPSSMGINLTNMTHVNRYKLDKYDLC